jgi:hypothetical protein
LRSVLDVEGADRTAGVEATEGGAAGAGVEGLHERPPYACARAPRKKVRGVGACAARGSGGRTLGRHPGAMFEAIARTNAARRKPDAGGVGVGSESVFGMVKVLGWGG